MPFSLLLCLLSANGFPDNRRIEEVRPSVCMRTFVNMCTRPYEVIPDNIAGEYPTRLGGNGHFWSFSARDSEQVVIGTDVYLAVSSSSVDSSQPGGAVFIYKFDKSRKSLTFVQVTIQLFLCKLTVKH